MKYIALLRGINVGGHKSLKMDLLKSILEKLKFENVKTYIQSGNVVFEFIETDKTILAKDISDEIHNQCGFEVPTMVFDIDEFKHIISSNPFLKEDKDPLFFHVTLLASNPTSENILSLDKIDLKNNAWKIHENALYLYCPEGYSQCKISNNFLENKWKMQATTRNWKTMLMLSEMSEE